MSKNTNLSFLTDYITADITNGRIGINNASPAFAFDVSGATRISGVLTLTSTISNGTYTYTLPSATGTLALTSTLSGTTNYIPKFTSSSAIGNSSILDNGTGRVSIGTTSFNDSFVISNSGTTGWEFGNSGSVITYNRSTSAYIPMTFQASSFGFTGAATFSSSVSSGTKFISSVGNNQIVFESLSATTGYQYIQLLNTTAHTIFGIEGTAAGSLLTGGLAYGSVFTSVGNTALQLGTNQTARMTITSAGNVGIGTTTPNTKLVVTGGVTNSIATISASFGTNNAINIGDDGTNGVLGVGNSGTDMVFLKRVAGVYSEAMRITSGGNVGIGTTTPGVKLEVNGGGAAVAMTIATSGATTAGCLWDGGGAPSFHAWSRPDDCGIGSNNFAGKSILIKTGMTYGSFTTGTTRIEIQSSGAVVIPGSLSKGSGSFRIDHPLKPDTHQLVHSFIEGPQADLIYRGKLTLVNGKAQANIDEVSTMTEGTFEALCREVQCFTTNENGWDLVKGKVIGNIIHIESQNPNSTDEISWMVIGERKDKHMMDTEWTDEQGKVIVEPLKQK